MSILTSGVINSTNLIRQSYANIYNLINNRSNVPDPNSSAGTRKFIYTRMPKIDSRNFAGFPFIIVERTKPSKKIGSADLTKSFINFDNAISVYSKDKETDSTGYPSGEQTNEEITENIRKTLDNATNQRTLLNQAMAHLSYNIDTSEDEDFDGILTYISKFDLRFENNLITTG